jgi:DNA-binding NarL/FixJ family response regulator
MKDIKSMTIEECIEALYADMLRGAYRTSDGFECIFLHPTYSIRYQVYLPYSNVTCSGLVYKRVGVDDLWHSIKLCTVSFARSLVVMVRRNLYARMNALNADIELPSIAARVLEYMAAGYTMKETQEKLGITQRVCRTATQNIMNAVGARSMPQAIAQYMYWQTTEATKEASFNPHILERTQ